MEAVESFFLKVFQYFGFSSEMLEHFSYLMGDVRIIK
jgi:hypothetical protein